MTTYTTFTDNTTVKFNAAGVTIIADNEDCDWQEVTDAVFEKLNLEGAVICAGDLTTRNGCPCEFFEWKGLQIVNTETGVVQPLHLVGTDENGVKIYSDPGAGYLIVNGSVNEDGFVRAE